MVQTDLNGNPVNSPSGYIMDYVSDQLVKEGPEEVNAVQVFSKRLVNEYGYSKGQIQTRPQFRVKASPSGENKYPVDIAVFNDDRKIYNNLYIIVECKEPTRIDGRDQLELYMGLSTAQIGVWFNGKEHLYLQKIYYNDGRIEYREIPNIPKKGQRIEDIGKYRRKNLQPPTDLKIIFRDIRNHLAGMTTGITMDIAFAQELMNILFCKVYDETHTAPNEETSFRAGVAEPPENVKKRISDLFEKKVKSEYLDVFDKSDYIKLDCNSLVYVVGELQNYCITEANTDAIGDAFEVFIGKGLRGEEGQFFTPRNVVRMMIEILEPSPSEFILDPACGSGGFLIVALKAVWSKVEEEGRRKNWSSTAIEIRKREIASKFFYGIDKDSFLAKVTKAYMALVGDGKGGIFCVNSLKESSHWNQLVSQKVPLNSFDVIITNPPFGSKIQVRGEDILSQYDLARVWQKDRISGTWRMTSTLRKQQAPQILFVERCIQLLKPGGRLGIILPESLFGNPSYGYIIEYLKQRAKFLGLVSLPEELFQPYTHNKTCAVFVEKSEPVKGNYPVFMGVVKWCGQDSRGNKIPLDDVPLLAPNYEKLVRQKIHPIKHDRLGFIKNFYDVRNNILIPKYYDPEIESELEELNSTHQLVTIGQLVNDKAISLSTGVEIGKLSYGTGIIPFIRTSDLANWELKIDPKHGVNKKIFDKYSKKCNVQEGDILFVRDGTYLIGTTALITKHDVGILFQSHIYKIRILKQEVISAYLLLALLNSPLVKKQIRSKQFTQDIIDTLGRRILEVVLPLPRNKKFRENIERSVKTIVEQRSELKNQARQIAIEVIGKKEITLEERELMEQL